MIWLGITMLLLCTGIFLFCAKRLHSRRYCHKIFLHSFTLLILTFLTSYFEATIGIVISCIFYLEKENIPNPLLYSGTFSLFISTSISFAVTLLRQYRIFLLTYIEKGLFKYSKLISRKSRLSKSWNSKVLIGYLVFILSIFTPLILLRKFITTLGFYEYLSWLITSIRFLECTIELIGIVAFMNKNIPKAYRIESYMLLFVTVLNAVSIASLGMITYLTYSIISILKTVYVIIYDSYVNCYLISANEMKPLLPPIYMIQSSLFVVEIKLVYDLFCEFLKVAQVKKWDFLLEFLMEIQMLKSKNSQALKENLQSYLSFAEMDCKELWVALKEHEHENFEEKLLYYESEIIHVLDNEAFEKFKISPFYLQLEEKFTNLRNSYSLNPSF